MAEKVEKKNDEVVISMRNDGSSVPPSCSEDTTSEGAKQPHNGAATKKGRSAKDIENLVLDVLICIVITPLYLLVALAAYLIFDINLTKYGKPQHEEQENRISFENVLQKCRDAAVGAAKLVLAIRIQIVFTLLVWLVINLSVPGLRRKTVLGSPLWKWSLLVVIIACGYIAIKRVVIFTLALLLNEAEKDGGYYARGLRSSIKLIIFSASVFCFWHFHFLSHHGLKDAQDGVDYVTWTMVALLIFSVLWLFKTILLLRWEAEAVYHRYTTRMLRAGFQAYFLVAVMEASVRGDKEHEEERMDGCWPKKRERMKQRDKLKQKAKQNLMPSSQDVKTYRSNLNPKKEEKDAFFEGEEKQDATTLSLKLIASYLILLAKGLSRGDDEISRLQARCREINSTDPDQCITADDLKKFQLDDNESVSVYKVLQGNPPMAKVITYQMFEEWMKPKESSETLILIPPVIKQSTTLGRSTRCFIRWKDSQFDVQKAVQGAIVNHRRILKSLKESSTEDDIANLQAKCRKIKNDHEYIISKTDLGNFRLDEIESEVLYEEVQGNPPSEKVTYAMFEKWMVRAYKYSLALGYTLLHAKEVVDCLNLIMSGLVIAVVILARLLLTGIASTKVLIAIMSPFLAATFIFGDTCKTLFEGIIFAFVKHPFAVGDRCIIDGIEMEVKRMSILTTIFLKLSPPEEIFYPNSVLATKPIVNLKDAPDPSDAVELNLDGDTTKEDIEALKEEIANFLNSNDHAHKYEGPIQVMLKEVGSSIKMDVCFKHSMSNLDNHAQCSQWKKMQRSEFLLHVKQFLDDLGISRATD
ncbi:hypothetical protein Ancab_012481 [Ancistrocladus abbreviatus]